MEKHRLEAFKERLRQQIQDLEQEMSAAASSTKPVELDQQSVGRLSRMDALQNQAMAQAAKTRRTNQIARLRQAIRRIEGDEFGFCSQCGDDIEADRLDFDPTIQTCKDCAMG